MARLRAPELPRGEGSACRPWLTSWAVAGGCGGRALNKRTMAGIFVFALVVMFFLVYAAADPVPSQPKDLAGASFTTPPSPPLAPAEGVLHLNVADTEAEAEAEVD